MTLPVQRNAIPLIPAENLAAVKVKAKVGLPIPIYPKNIKKHLSEERFKEISKRTDFLNVKVIEGANNLPLPQSVGAVKQLTNPVQNIRFFIQKTIREQLKLKLGSVQHLVEKVTSSAVETMKNKATNFLQTLSKADASKTGAVPSANNESIYQAFYHTDVIEQHYQEMSAFSEKIGLGKFASQEAIQSHIEQNPEYQEEYQLKKDAWQKTAQFEHFFQHIKKGITYSENELVKDISSKIKEAHGIAIDHSTIRCLFSWFHQEKPIESMATFLKNDHIHLPPEHLQILIQRFADAIIKVKIDSIVEGVSQSLDTKELYAWVEREVVKLGNYFTQKAFEHLEEMSNEQYQQLFNEALEVFNYQIKAETEARKAVEQTKALYAEAISILDSNLKPKSKKQKAAQDRFFSFLKLFRPSAISSDTPLKKEDLSEELLEEYCQHIHYETMTAALKSVGKNPIDLFQKKLLRLFNPEWEEKGIKDILQNLITYPPQLQEAFESFQFLKKEIFSEKANFILDGNLFKMLSSILIDHVVDTNLTKQINDLFENISNPENILFFANTTILPSVKSALVGTFIKNVVSEHLPTVMSLLNQDPLDFNDFSTQILGLVKQESQVNAFDDAFTEEQFRFILKPIYTQLLQVKNDSLEGDPSRQFERFKAIFNVVFFPQVEVNSNPLFGELLKNLSELADLPPFLKWLVKNNTVNQILSKQLSYAFNDYSTHFFGILNAVNGSFVGNLETQTLLEQVRQNSAESDQLLLQIQGSEDFFEISALNQERAALAALIEADQRLIQGRAPLYELKEDTYQYLSLEERNSIRQKIRNEELKAELTQRIADNEKFLLNTQELQEQINQKNAKSQELLLQIQASEDFFEIYALNQERTSLEKLIEADQRFLLEQVARHTEHIDKDRKLLSSLVTPSAAELAQLDNFVKHSTELEAHKTAKLAQETLGYITNKNLPFGRWAINKVFGSNAKVALKAIRQVGHFFKNKIRNKAIALEISNVATQALDPSSTIAPISSTEQKSDWKALSVKKTMNKIERIALAIFTLGISELVLWIIDATKSPFNFNRHKQEIAAKLDQVIKRKEQMKQSEIQLQSEQRQKMILEQERRSQRLNKQLTGERARMVSYIPPTDKVPEHREKFSPLLMKARKTFEKTLKLKTDEIYETKIASHFVSILSGLDGLTEILPIMQEFTETVNLLVDGSAGPSPLKNIVEKSTLTVAGEIFNRIGTVLSNLDPQKWKSKINQMPILINQYLANPSLQAAQKKLDPQARISTLSKKLINLICPGTPENPKSSYELIFDKIFEENELQSAYDTFYGEIADMIEKSELISHDIHHFITEHAEHIKEVIKTVVVHSVQKNIEKMALQKMTALFISLSDKATWDQHFESSIYPAATQLLLEKKSLASFKLSDFDANFDQWLSKPETFFEKAGHFFYDQLREMKIPSVDNFQGLFFKHSSEKNPQSNNTNIELRELPPLEAETAFDYDLTKEILASTFKQRLGKDPKFESHFVDHWSGTWINLDPKMDQDALIEVAVKEVLIHYYPTTENKDHLESIQLLSSFLKPSFSILFDEILIMKTQVEPGLWQDHIKLLIREKFGPHAKKVQGTTPEASTRPYIDLVRTLIQKLGFNKTNRLLGVANFFGQLDPLLHPIASLIEPISNSPEWLIRILIEKLNFFVDKASKSFEKKLPAKVSAATNNNNIPSSSSSEPQEEAISPEKKEESVNQQKFSQLLFNILSHDSSKKIQFATTSLLKTPQHTEEILENVKNLLFDNPEMLSNLLLTFFESFIDVLEIPEKQAIFATHTIVAEGLEDRRMPPHPLLPEVEEKKE